MIDSSCSKDLLHTCFEELSVKLLEGLLTSHFVFVLQHFNLLFGFQSFCSVVCCWSFCSYPTWCLLSLLDGWDNFLGFSCYFFECYFCSFASFLSHIYTMHAFVCSIAEHYLSRLFIFIHFNFSPCSLNNISSTNIF